MQKKIIGIIAIGIYASVAMFLAICLLNYNDYNITEFKDKSLIIISNDELTPDFSKGDLVIVYKNKTEDIQIGDKIFFYNTSEDKVSINLEKLVDKKTNGDEEITFIMDEEYEVEYEKIIGTTKTSKIYPNIGKFLGFLESKYGFLLIIIFPIITIFIYEIYAIIKEVRK